MASFAKLAKLGLNFTKLLNADRGPSLSSLNRFLLPTSFVGWDQERNYAARKGTRLRKMQKIKKSAEQKEEVKKEFVPHKLKKKEKEKKVKKRSEMGKNLIDAPCDNVYCFRHYKWIKNKFEDAIKMHRQSHHPTIYNEPNALVYAYLELDLTLPKKNRLLDVFSSLVRLPHDFEYGAPRQVLAVCSRPEEQERAKEAGAHIIGGTEIISMIQSGDLATDEFQYVVSTPDLINSFIPIRGILKNKFPMKANGTLSFDVKAAVDKFVNGTQYKSKVDPYEKEYGIVEVPIGRLPMDSSLLEENLDALIKDVCSRKKTELGPFITMVFITSPPSQERIVVAHEKYLPIVEVAEEKEI